VQEMMVGAENEDACQGPSLFDDHLLFTTTRHTVALDFVSLLSYYDQDGRPWRKPQHIAETMLMSLFCNLVLV